MKAAFFLAVVVFCSALYALWQDNIKERAQLENAMHTQAETIQLLQEEKEAIIDALNLRESEIKHLQAQRTEAQKKVHHAIQNDAKTHSWSIQPVPNVYSGLF